MKNHNVHKKNHNDNNNDNNNELNDNERHHHNNESPPVPNMKNNTVNIAFTLTPLLKNLLHTLQRYYTQSVASSLNHENDDDDENIASQQQQPSESVIHLINTIQNIQQSYIYYSQIKQLIPTLKTVQKECETKGSSNKSKSKSFPVHSYLLLQGSSIYIPPKPIKKKSPDFEAYLERCRQRQDRKEYLTLMYGKAPIEHGREREDYEDDEELDDDIDMQAQSLKFDQNIRSTLNDLGLGVNILTLMFTGFLLGYFAATQLFPESKIAPAALGLGGLIVALGIEATLVLLRESKLDSIESSTTKRTKRKHASAQRLERIHESMRTTMLQMEEWKKTNEEHEPTLTTQDDATSKSIAAGIRRRKPSRT